MNQSNANLGFKYLSVFQSAVNSPAPKREELEELIKKYAPVISFHQDEACMPVNVAWYLQRAWLVNAYTKTRVPASLENLPQGANNAHKYYLEPKEGISLLGGNDQIPARAYVHAKIYNKSYTDLQYWFFFAQTGNACASVKWMIDDIKGHEGKINLNPLGRTNGNWEKITVRLNNKTQEAEQVFFPQSGEGKWVQAEDLQRVGSQIKVFASKNGFAFYPGPGNKHSEKLKFNLYSSKLEFCFLDEAAQGKELDFSRSCELVSAGYLSENRVEEPLWLNFYNNWGAPKPDYLMVSSVKRIVLSTFGKTLEFLLSRDILDQLVNYLVSYFSNECRYKSLTPKAVKCWYGEC
jgi:hypothetical protein